VALKKPTEYFKKQNKVVSVDESIEQVAKLPEINTFSDAFESFKSNLGKIETLSSFSDTLDNYRINVERINYISEKVDSINEEIRSYLKKEDLDHAMMAQLLVVEDSLKEVQAKVKGINETDLAEIRIDVSTLTDSVNDFLENDVPKYKKLIVDSEFRTDKRFTKFEKNINETLEGIGELVDKNYTDKDELIQQVTEKINEVKELSKIVSDDLETNAFYKDQIKERVAGLEVNILRNEKHITDQNKNLQEIEEQVKHTFSKINVEEIERQNHKLAKKIKYIEEVFEKFSEKEILTENNFTEPPYVKTTDHITPLNQNFVTLDQLQQHYRLFINRVQQQLATLGGGGETRLKYLDDIVGIATNPAAYDGKFLKYNHPEKNFEFVTVEAGGPTDNITTNSISIVDNESDTQYFDEVVTLQKATTAVTNTTNPTSIHKVISISNYATVEYLIQATKGLSVNTVKLLSVNDTININTIEVYSASIGSTFVNYSINIDDGFVNLVATPNDISTIIYNISYTAITRQKAEFIIKTEDDQIILTEDGDMIQTEVA
jgi:hypothetical protein